MNYFITIAGPQSSGKTTALKHLQTEKKDWYFVEEINPYTIAGINHPGAAFVDRDLEINLVKIELAKISSLKDRVQQNVAVETGIGHVVYTQFFAGKPIADQFYNDYLRLYNDLNPFLIFIDTRPEVSFSRRQKNYEERIKNKGITGKKDKEKTLKKYRDIIFELYPLWLKFYEKFPYPKVKIENSVLNREKFLNELNGVVNSLLSRSSPR